MEVEVQEERALRGIDTCHVACCMLHVALQVEAEVVLTRAMLHVALQVEAEVECTWRLQCAMIA